MFSKNIKKDSNDPNNITRPVNPMSKSFENLNEEMFKHNEDSEKAPKFFFGTGYNGTSKIVENKDDPNKGLNYIILQNDEFHQKHETFLKEISELKHENEILEEDNGRMESDKTRLMGLAFNEAGKNLQCKKALVLYDSEIQEKYKVYKNLNHMVLKIVLTIFVVQMAYLSLTSFVLSKKDNLLFAVLPIIGVFLTDGLVFLSAKFLVKPIYEKSLPFRNIKFFWDPDSMNSNHALLNEILGEISEIEKASEYLEQLIN
jgi:hypothetical protein